MENIFRGPYSEGMNIRSLLENNNIEVFIENEYMSSIEPWVIASGGLNPIILKVKDSDIGNAVKVITDFEKRNLS